MLSPVLLERLRAWWRVGHAQGKMLPNGWLFPGLNPMEQLSTRQLNRAIHLAADAARIDKRVSVHTLPQLRNASAGAEGGHPRDPGAAGTPAPGDHLAETQMGRQQTGR
jgi:integrase